MSFLMRVFKKSGDEDYETILSTLLRDIQSRQQKLADIRLRERRATLSSTIWTLAAYVLYVSLWYFKVLVFRDANGRRNGVEKALMSAPVVIGPIMVLFIRRIVQLWYSRKEAIEEKMLQQLLKQQRTKVEEIKKKTNYYSTRDLLSKYDDQPQTTSPPPQQVLRQRVNAAPATTPQTPVSNGNGIPRLPPSGSASLPQAPLGLVNPALSGLSPSPFLATPTRKEWYDKLADALLGEDDQQQGPPSSRYALICEKCFKHNGLVKESMWEDVQYVCPKCNHFNASVRSKREQVRRSASPGSPPAAPSTPSPVRSAKAKAQSPRTPSPQPSPEGTPLPESDRGSSPAAEDKMDEEED